MNRNLHAASLEMMLSRMEKYATGGPGQGAILADMRKLTDGVGALAVLAESTDDLTSEQRLTRTTKAASKFQVYLPGFLERLDRLGVEIPQGFELAFAQNSGLFQTERAGEIRAHVKNLKDIGERSAFLQTLLKTGDNESMAAVVFAPAFLSGLDVTTHSRFRTQIEETRLPELSKNREVFAGLSGNLRTALTVAEKAIREFSNPRLLAEMEQRALAAKEAEARLNASTAAPFVVAAAIGAV